MKWEKGEVPENAIVQALDIHFPLSCLSLEKPPQLGKNKQVLLLKPDPNSIGDCDSVTIKALFHRPPPDSLALARAFSQNGVIPIVNIKLSNGEFFTLASKYSKRLPIEFE